PEASFLGWMPTMDVVPTPGRQLNSDTVAGLVSAIRGQRPVSVLYQSMSQAAPQTRTISPHALANDGFRWHVRAFCHLRQQFRDFVIARILKIDASTEIYVEPAADEHWATTVELKIVPNPELAEAHRRVIELDYCMVGGRSVLNCRQALLFYALKHLGLDHLTGGSPKAHHVVLENRSEIEPLLAGHSG
ncbi:MAG: WYL domain-containing protein, partial [Rhodoferax sp.]|nr:WYL domain-containing protein [Rhodoferax sp.]